MKNNELLLTVRFQSDNFELTLLLNKDITLKALLEVLYYGLKSNAQTHFEIFKSYTKIYTQLVVLYCAKKELEFVDVKKNIDKKLYELGIVTTSCILIPDNSEVKLEPLFSDYDLPTLCDKSKLEYNISTRRIAVAEPSVIDIIPPEEMPEKQKRRYGDIIIPTVISMGLFLQAVEFLHYLMIMQVVFL